MAVPLLLLVALFVMQGCGGKSPELRSEEVLGAWKGSGGGRIGFREDGTFDMSGIPRSAVEYSFSTPPPGKGSFSGRGRWDLEGQRDPISGVELRFVEGGSFADDVGFALLRPVRSRDEPEMYFDVNPDTEDGYRVRREPSARSGRSSMPC
ncbi:hypothetical protein [Streptomyces sp. NPDC057545]|uniref:hypothetical protein n=1 Tax=Streptomyces sp. NPDC057545 TaxID=3346164 RepID=UPI0036D1E057